jgi:endonuclease/exonuclease/phosphatase family metal-dependent hydrolase
MLWKDMPNTSMPTQGHWTNAIIKNTFRLSSKSHWDIPVVVGGKTIHFLLSHPTPPAFDSGPLYHNRRRNHDEVVFWAHYITNDNRLIDDNGAAGGLAPGSSFIIAGDLNCYPNSTTTNYNGALVINTLLTNPGIQDTGEYTISQGAAAGKTTGAPKYYERSTATWGDGARVDYVLPDAHAIVFGGGVYWPLSATDKTGASYASGASDHRMVWVDIMK